MKSLLITLITCLTLITLTPASAQEVFRVQYVSQATSFYINGNHFTARDSCPGIKKDDPVDFTEGSPHGMCISAVFVDLHNGKECSVWCH